MSVRVMSEVFRYSEAQLGCRLVLLVMADFAGDEDWECWPGVARIASYTRLSERQVQRALRQLEAMGELRPMGRSDKRTTIYRITIGEGRHIVTPSIHSVGDIQSALRVTPTSPELELEPPVEPLETEPNGSVSPEKPEMSPIRDVYDHWRERRRKTNHRYETISENRRKKIQTRLTEFSAEDLKLAIDCVALDPWSERPLHDDLVVIFRNREQVEKFLAFSEPSVVPGKPERAPPRRYGYGVTAHEMFERARATATREEGQRNGAEASGGVGGAVDRGLPPGGN